MKRVAIPLQGKQLSSHFGQCESFGLYRIEGGKILDTEIVTPPNHQPGIYPRWLASLGVTDVISGGMGQKARALFETMGIKTTIGVPDREPEELVIALEEGILPTGENACNHS